MASAIGALTATLFLRLMKVSGKCRSSAHWMLQLIMYILSIGCRAPITLRFCASSAVGSTVKVEV